MRYDIRAQYAIGINQAQWGHAFFHLAFASYVCYSGIDKRELHSKVHFYVSTTIS